MPKQELDHGWKLIDLDPDAGNAAEMSAAGLDTSGWLDISVPGDVNAALVAAGRMPDPHIADNARGCYWVTAKEWWYRLEFQAPSIPSLTREDLCLDGLDGHVDVYLNSAKIGHTENAFRGYRFDVTDLIRRDQPNVLLMRFRSIDQVLRGPRTDELAGWGNWRALMRKPQFSFGWDWALPLPSIGIAGSVSLERHKGHRLVDVSVEPKICGRLDFKFEVTRATREAGYELAVRVRGHGEDQQKKLDLRSVFSHASLTIEDPKLWWPNGMGEQPLYDYEVDLIVAGEVVDSRKGRIGIREVRIVEEPFTEDAGRGISFWIEINGRRAFCKGGNWIPMELWPAQATDEQYRFYLEKTAEANFNMQRVWGGGIYERDIFYDLCDELGIMVWQDFMFASTGYPLDILRDEITAEADYQLRRLRNHSSIVIWCGINEDVFSWGLPKGAPLASTDEIVPETNAERLQVDRLRDDPRIYTMILRGLTSKLGLGVPYIESSPQSYEDAGNALESGNSHQSCWKYALFETDGHPERYRDHFERVCSFDSEFCIQGPCDESTLRKFLTDEHTWPPDDVWTYHIQRGHKNLTHWEQTMMIAGGIFGPIDSLQQYVKYGQATHVEQMRSEFESARRDRPNNGGTMMWMYNDCWPTSNWSIIDYYRRPKPSYYAAKRACATLLPIVCERGGRIEFFVSNDGLEQDWFVLKFGQASLDGSVLWSEETVIETEGCDTGLFATVERSSLDLAAGDYMFIDATIGEKTLPRVIYFPGMWRDVPWPEPNVTVDVLDESQRNGGWSTSLRITTDAFARMCHLIAPDGDWLSDNYFDLCAGSSHVVQVRSAEKLDVSAIKVGHWWTKWP